MRKRIMKPRRYLTILLLIIPGLCFAEWTNLIKNYSRNDYKAGSQNWQIIQLDNRWMYFANKTGILEYNGKRWNLYPLRNNSDSRSLYYSRKDNRIYVGGVNEIGYLESSSNGEKHYYSLATPYENPTLHLGNIWKIYEIDEAIYFCGDQVVVKWINGVLTPIPSPDKIDCSSLINNTLYIGTASGIFVLAGEAFYRLPNTKTMTRKKLRAILPYNNKVMIATAREGLFLWDENGLTPFHTEADKFMKKNELFSIALQDNQIAIGTVLKGLVLITTEGKVLKYINELHGLQNNTILSVYFDFTGNLWLGLDNGIGYIALNYPVTQLYAASGFYGAGYVAGLHKGKMYLGTNRGLYVTNWPVLHTESAPDLKLIEGSQGQVWNLHVIDDRLFVCHDKGLFVMDSKEMKSMDLNIGIWEIRPIKQTKDKYLVSTYNGFYVMEKDERQRWKIRQVVSASPLSAINSSIINFEEVNGNQLYLRQNRSELAWVSLNNERDKVESEKNYHGDDIPDDFSIHQLMGKIVLCSPSGFYFCSSNGKFIPDIRLNRFFEFSGKNNSFRSILQSPTAIWALGEDILAVKYRNSAVTCYHTIPLITNFERIFPVGDSLAIIPNENGFVLWNTAASIKKTDHPLQITDIRIIKGNHQEENKLETDTNGTLKIPYRNNSLLVEYGIISYFNPYKVRFRTRLDNEEWSPFSAADNKVLSDLPIGSHTFKVETQLENGKILEDSFSFIVLPPWYLTTIAYIIYGVLLLFTFFLLWKWDCRRIEQKERQMKMIQEKELELKEEAFKTENEKKEQEIIRLTNEKLEMDIRHKSQELANSAIILGKKNEVLIEIKKSLSGIFDKSGHEISSQEIKRKILEVSYVIDGNIREDDIIHKFEENFDLVHNNFIKRLAETFPTLSVAERKMCTLIKMQLSSKEIAPLLNITVRGVETMRLRLRKKLGLQNESLTKFLNNF